MSFTCFFREFEEGYLELLKRRFGTKRTNANLVYQEYIAHKDHVHMNSTMWETLTDFVKWLGREGKELFQSHGNRPLGGFNCGSICFHVITQSCKHVILFFTCVDNFDLALHVLTISYVTLCVIP
jgi:hypothetical protein